MQWLLAGRRLGQAVKNVQRLRQILSVFAAHGFADVVERLRLGRFAPRWWRANPDDSTPTPERLRKAFETLGPTFVKFGQLLSTRPDLIPEAFIEEFTKLQDSVQPIPTAVVRALIEKELGRPVLEVFTQFDEQPLASASIAQVHEATLPDGNRVVLKIQRPEIRRMVETDVSILSFLAKLLERYVPETRIIGPSTVVDEFFRTISLELDFHIEANNISKIAKNMSVFDNIVIPRVFRELSTSRLLVLERLHGIKFNDRRGLELAGIDNHAIVLAGAKAFFRSIMIDGIFHGDLHGGNLFLLPGNKIGMIDFGIVGRLSQKSRDQLANMFVSLITEDYENLCFQYAELGAVDASIDFDAFQREIQNTLSPYLGLSLAEVNTGRVFIEATKIAARYRIKVPSEWMLVFRAILTLEGLGRSLDPNFDMLGVAQELAKDLVRTQFSPKRFQKDLLWIAKDTGALLKSLPRQLRWMIRKFNSNDFALEVKSTDLQALTEHVERGSRRIAAALVATGLAIAWAVSLPVQLQTAFADMPVPTLVGLAVIVLLALRGLLL